MMDGNGRSDQFAVFVEREDGGNNLYIHGSRPMAVRQLEVVGPMDGRATRRIVEFLDEIRDMVSVEAADGSGRLGCIYPYAG